jgi:hypothetical protein
MTAYEPSDSIHWYSYGERPQGISDTFNVLARLLPDYRKLHQESHAGESPFVFYDILPMPIRTLLSEEGELNPIDLEDEL